MTFEQTVMEAERNGKEEGIAEGLVKGRAQGLAQGLTQGLAEGTIKGKLEVLLTLVKDNTLSIEEAAKIVNLTEAEFTEKLMSSNLS